jgi:hypothetical protein
LTTVDPYLKPEEKESLFAWASGWGHTEVAGLNRTDFHNSMHLKYLKVPLIKTTECEIITQVTAMEICGGYLEGGKDYCVDDTGGPLIIPGYNQSAIIYGILIELVSKELNHLAAILHVFAGGSIFIK